MGAATNHIVYEGVIVDAKTTDNKVTLFVANTTEEPKGSDLTMRVELDAKQSEKVKEVLYISSKVMVEGKLDVDDKGLYISVEEMKYKNPSIKMGELK